MQSPPPPLTVLESNSRTDNFLFDLVHDLTAANEDGKIIEPSENDTQDEEKNTEEAYCKKCQNVFTDDDDDDYDDDDEDEKTGQIVSDGLGKYIGRLAKKVLPSKKAEPPLSAEDQIDQNLDEIAKAVERMKEMVVTMGGEIDSQIKQVDHLNTEVAAATGKVKHATDKVNDLLEK